MPSLRFGRGAVRGSASAARSTCSGTRDPTSTVTIGASPSTKPRTISPRRDNKWAFTQSTAKRFGASSLRAPLLSTACSGRTQVLKCSPGSSFSRARTQRAHNPLSIGMLSRVAVNALPGWGGAKNGGASLAVLPGILQIDC